MQREIAVALLPLVSATQFDDVISEYVGDRLSVLHTQLEIAKGENVIRIQGQIAELRLLLKLKDDVNSSLKRKD